MAFIAINAKADIEGSKKGKLTPAQNAMVNAFCLSKKTGFFNIGGKCEATRERYDAVEDKATVIFKNGFFAICGRIVEIEEGTTITITLPTYGTDIGNIIATFDLSRSGENEFKVEARTGSLTQEDLNIKANGKYDFVLYKYEATNSGVKLTPRDKYEYIQPESNSVATYFFGSLSAPLYDPTQEADSRKYANNIRAFFKYIIGDGFTENIEDWSSETDPSGKSPLNAYDVEKGTIETRLRDIDTRLSKAGFSEGSVSGLAGATLTKMGKYAILEIPANSIDFGFAPSGSKTYKMSFVSAESFVVVDKGLVRYSLSKNSDILIVGYGGSDGSRYNSYMRIGFKIV